MLRQGLHHVATGLAARPSPGHTLNTAIRRQASSASGGGGGGGKALLGLGVTGMAVIGGTVGYAGVDKDFRRTVEDSLPGSNAVLSMIHGDLEPEKPQKKVMPPPSTATPPSKLRPTVIPSTEMKLLEGHDKEELAKVNKAVTPLAPPLEKPAFMKKKEEKKPEPEKKKVPEPVVAADAVVASVASVKKEEEEEEVSKPKAKKEAAPVKEEEDEEQVVAKGKAMHKNVVAVREELETEMRAQLKRQAEAHSDHIADALDVQKRELTRENTRKLDELAETSQLSRRNELAGIVGHLKGLQASLQNRSEMDAASLEAQELWLACSALQLAVENHDDGGKPIRSLNKEISAVKSVLENNSQDPFVSAVLASIPDVAFRRGVATPGAIKARFLKVEEMAKRTAMIGNDGGSLFKYFLSYVQSKFIMEPASLKELPSKTTATDVDKLNTFELVWLARGSLDRGDLEQAVKYMTLLQGEPRNVAQDWVKEARLFLETKQATRALMAHAAAVGVEALPMRRKH